jgi:ferritin
MNLKGFAKWMKIQAGEETKHGMKIYEFLEGRGGRVILQQINAPPSNQNSAREIFEAASQHEHMVTESIDKIVELARAEKDNATEVFLQWFVTEQVEEEASTGEISQKLQLIGDNAPALLMLDAELGKRSA